jgi:hypothetical protein
MSYVRRSYQPMAAVERAAHSFFGKPVGFWFRCLTPLWLLFVYANWMAALDVPRSYGFWYGAVAGIMMGMLVRAWGEWLVEAYSDHRASKAPACATHSRHLPRVNSGDKR